MSSTTRGSANGGKLAHFSLDFDAKSLDFVSCSAAENHIFFADAGGFSSLVLSIVSVLRPPDSTNCMQNYVERKSLLYTGVRPPAPTSRFVVVFLALNIA